MPSPELIQERLISGKGVLKVPDDKKKVRTYILYTDVIREPKSKYLNLAYNPGKSRYGTINFLRNGYVINTLPIEFPRQSFDGVNDISGQTLLAVKCAYDGILESFNRQSAALGLIVLPYTDLIKDYENLRLSWDEIRIVCYADTALQVRLYSTKYDVCDEDKDKDQPPPPPPPPLPPVPPGTPIGSISPPYDEDTNDDNNTQPFDDDEIDDGLPDDECVLYAVTIRVYGNWGDPDGVDPVKGLYRNITRNYWSPIEPPITIRTGTPRVQLPCKGDDSGACREFTNFPVVTGQPESPSYGDAEIISATPV